MAGTNQTPEEQIMDLKSQLAFLAGAATGVVHEMDRIHDLEEWPLKYRAPWKAITNLREILESLEFVQQLTTPTKILIHKPGYWMNETTGVLRPAIEAFCRGDELTADQIAAIRAYFRQWIASPAWQGPRIELLRKEVEILNTTSAIRSWLIEAVKEGIDPL